MAVDSSWESVVKQITGFDGGTRAMVGAVGGADAKSGNGSEWMQVKVEKVTHWIKSEYRETTGSIDTAGGTGRVIKFYGPSDGWSSTGILVYKVTITLPWSSSTGADWSNTGNAGAYDYGFGKALQTLRDTYTSEGFGGEYPYAKAVTAENAINLRNFSPMAEAFNRVVDYFSAKSTELEKWVKQLDGAYSAYQGSGADVFRDLIDAVGLGYKDFLTLIAPTSGVVQPGGGRDFKGNATFKSRSSVGDSLADAELAIWTAADTLAKAWEGWQSGTEERTRGIVDSAYTNPLFRPANVWLGTSHLDALLNELADWLNQNNISKMKQSSAGVNGVGEGFLHQHPVYGNLTIESDWKNISTLAYNNWLATLGPLDLTAGTVMTDLNQAMIRLGSSSSSFTFKAGVSSLKEANAADEAGRAAEEAAKEKENAQKEIDKLKKDANGGGAETDIKPPPQIGQNDTDGQFGGGTDGSTGGDGTNGGNGGKGTGLIPPPTLDLNGTNGNSGLGGPGSTVRNPDGSTSVRNPDGSTTTTYPDGRTQTTPPGVIPPLLPPNNTGGWGPGVPTGAQPVRTVKGPAGSTISYNTDGSTTTTHKDGTTTTVHRDGTSVTTNPDGSRTVLNKDGSETITYRDGTKTAVKPDGTTTTTYPDGTSTKLAPDGTLTTTDAQGNSTTSHPAPGSTVKNPDGSTTVYGKDGSTTTTHEDGTKTTVAPNGTVTTIDPDGTKTVSHLGKGTSTIQYADGSVSQVGADGTVSTTYKDGSTTKLGPDGTYTTTDAEGNKKTEHLNTTGGSGGTRTTHNPDGSTTTTYPDGTVDKKLKDGGHQISYPDGRTVTTDPYGRTTGVTGGPPGTGGLGPNKTGGLGPNKTGGGFDYYDYPDSKNSASPLGSGGYGGSSAGSGGGGPRLPLNPLGGQGFTPGAGTGAAAGAGLAGDRGRAIAAGETAAARSGKAAQLAAEEAAMMARRPNTSSNGGTPMMPPMGGMGGGGAGGNTQSDERERSTWVSEDEDTWGTDEGGVSAVIGR